MAEIHINPNDIKPYIESYSSINQGFVFLSYVGTDSKKICTFCLSGKQCKIEFFFKLNSVTIISVGQNKQEAKLLIDYIESKGFSATAATQQISFKCTKNTILNLIKRIREEYSDLASYTVSGNNYRFVGYNKDYINLNFYEASNKATIQGRPYSVFNLIITILSEVDDISFEEIVNINNAITNQSLPYDAVRKLVALKVGKAGSYLGDALLKSISASLCQQNQSQPMEDYSGWLLGVFKALEGYLKKLLVQKFGYKLKDEESLSMFRIVNGKYDIENNAKISVQDLAELIKLYRLYKHKRNVYSHATVDPTMTRIIENRQEAIDISEETLKTIKDSFEVIFR